MGRGPRFWFPLALLGFAQLGTASVRLMSTRGPARRLWDFGDYSPNYARLEFRASDDFHVFDPALPTGLMWLVALGVAILGTAVWYGVTRRPARIGWYVLGTVGALLAVPLLDLVGSWQFRIGDGLRGPLLATLGLLVLAAYERSVFVLLTAGAFAVVAVVLLPDTAGVLLSAAVLLAAAFAALLRHRPDTAADTR